MSKRNWCPLYLAAVVAIAAAPLSANAQVRYNECVSLTGNNAHLVIPAGVATDIRGESAASGDELAVYTPEGVCAGAVVWGNSARAVIIWGDDDFTAQKESFVDGEDLEFRFWDKSRGVEHRNVEVSLLQSDPFYRTETTYAEDAVYVLESLAVPEDLRTPILVSPADSARTIALSPKLRWEQLDGVTGYEVQVATKVDFSTPAVSKTVSVTELALAPLQPGTTYYWRVRGVTAMGTTAYATASFTTVFVQDVALSAGWNLISGRVEPVPSDFNDVFGSLQSEVLLAKNGTGQMYYPEFDINTIGNWSAQQGYLVYAKKAASLKLTGEVVNPGDPIRLNAGWNTVAYWPEASLSVPVAMASAGNKVVLVKNGAGEVWLPEFGVNSIGSARAGEGYQIYVTASADLVYPAGSGKTAASKNAVATGGTSAHLPSSATLLVLAPDLEDGVELSVRTNDRSIGEATVESGRAVFALRGDDGFTKEVIEGALENEQLSLVLGEGSGEKLNIGGFRDLFTSGISQELRYAKDGAWVAEVSLSSDGSDLPSAFQLEQNYPNPFNPQTTIAFTVPEAAKVQLEVFNVLGQSIRMLVDESRSAGRYEVQFDAADLPSGMYLYRLSVGKHVAMRQMVLLK